MKPAEVALAFEQFKKETESWDENRLLDEWIAHNDKVEKAPDLDVLKSASMEALLIKQFGLMDWRKAVDARRNDARNA